MVIEGYRGRGRINWNWDEDYQVGLLSGYYGVLVFKEFIVRGLFVLRFEIGAQEIDTATYTHTGGAL